MCAGQGYPNCMAIPPGATPDSATDKPQSRRRWIPLSLRIYITFLLLTGAVSVFCVLTAIYYFQTHLFAGGDEFSGLPGTQANGRLGGAWPAEVEPTAVTAVSFKSESSIDSHSHWYRIQLSPEPAAAWQDAVHARKEQFIKGRKDKDCEGLHLVIAGPPALRTQTGTAPGWWTPPAIKFRATEAMLWYRDYDSGFGQAVYTGFDESTGTLWIYDYSCQHDLLWKRGNMPDGEHFMTLGRAGDNSSGSSQLVIQMGDSLNGTIKKLQKKTNNRQRRDAGHCVGGQGPQALSTFTFKVAK